MLLRARIGACLEKKYLHDQEQRHLATIEGMADRAGRVEPHPGAAGRRADRAARPGRPPRSASCPARLAETIVATGDESLLESHRRQIAIVFCDLRGFTPFSETAEPEEVMDVLAEYHAAMGELISRYEGTVEHFAGDGLMVLFNDPFPCPDPEVRAVRMAVEMRDRMAELGRGLAPARPRAWLRRRHLARRTPRSGSIGFEGRFHYAAIGSVVNLAARLCGEAKDGQILASRRVGLAVEDCRDRRAGRPT